MLKELIEKAKEKDYTVQIKLDLSRNNSYMERKTTYTGSMRFFPKIIRSRLRKRAKRFVSWLIHIF